MIRQMEVRRTIASTPVRNVDETCERLLELAGEWGGAELIGDLSPAQGVLSGVVLERAPLNMPLIVEYDTHFLKLYCAYETDALAIDEEDESLPSRIPHPAGEDLVWKLHVPCPASLWKWASAQIKAAGIGKWCLLEPLENTSTKNEKSCTAQGITDATLVDIEALRAAMGKSGNQRG